MFKFDLNPLSETLNVQFGFFLFSDLLFIWYHRLKQTVSFRWIHSDNTWATLLRLRCCEELNKNQPDLKKKKNNKKSKYTFIHVTFWIFWHVSCHTSGRAWIPPQQHLDYCSFNDSESVTASVSQFFGHEEIVCGRFTQEQDISQGYAKEKLLSNKVSETAPTVPISHNLL